MKCAVMHWREHEHDMIQTHEVINLGVVEVNCWTLVPVSFTEAGFAGRKDGRNMFI